MGDRGRGHPWGVWEVGGHPGVASGTPMVMPCATGTPTQGGGWGHPQPPLGCWSTLSCCKELGRKQPLRVGRGFSSCFIILF